MKIANVVKQSQSKLSNRRTSDTSELLSAFLSSSGPKANRDVSRLQTHDIARSLDREAKERARATANLSLKVLRVCFGEAEKQDLLTVNPVKRVKFLKSSKEAKRRGFTLADVKRILKECAENVECRGLVLFGLYLGQRAGRPSKTHVARNRFRYRRDCVQHAQD